MNASELLLELDEALDEIAEPDRSILFCGFLTVTKWPNSAHLGVDPQIPR
jgi:hypothetical protein